MTTYRLWPSTNGPASVASDATDYSMGVEFEITGAGGITAIYWWAAANSPAAAIDVGLFALTSGTAGTLVSGTLVSGTVVTAGQWNRIALPAGVVLTPGQRYRAVVYSVVDNFYSATGAYWTSGAGSAGITNGILSAPSNANALGNHQGSFDDFPSGAAISCPNSSFNGGNYWVDVEIDNTVGGVNYTGTATRTGTGTLTAAGIVDSQASITQVGTATTYQTATGTSSTIIDVPTGVVEGDLLWWVVSNQAVDVIATPTDWNLAAQENVTGLATAVFWRYVPASPPASYTAVTPSGRDASTMTAWRGVNTPTPFDVAVPASTTSTTLPQITTVTDNALILAVAGNAYVGSLTYTGTNADAIVAQIFSTGATLTNAGNAVASKLLATAGAFTPTFTVDVTPERSQGMTFALRAGVLGERNSYATVAGVGSVTTAGTVAEVGGTTHSFYGATAPPGTAVVGTDGTPNIVLGQTYYRTGTTARWVTGARVWVPASSLATQITLMLWRAPTTTDGVRTTQYNVNTTPQQTKTVAVTPGGWVEGTFDSPVQMPNSGYRVMVGYQFTDRPADYVYCANQWTTGAAIPFPTLSDFYISHSDDPATTFGPCWRTNYRIGTGAVGTALYPAGHGIDVLVSDSGPAPADYTGTATLTGTGTLSASWEITNYDGAATCAGIGTITAAAAGTLTIAAENALTGQGRAFWLDGIGSTSMPAFARSTYYSPGQTAQFSIGYNSAFTVDIWRLGHYAGNGARSMQTGITGTPTAQPTPVAITGGNGAITCAAWSVNGSWTVPANATPGWYWAVLRGGNGTDFGHIMFCVSDVAAKKPVLLVTGDATWHAAYNGYGGNNVYGPNEAVGDANGRAFCSTYDKPVITMHYVPQTHFMNNTYPMLKYLESVGIEVGVTTIEQIKNDPTILDGRDVIVWSGHNEYIPQSVMDKTKALLAAGQNMVNAAANDFFWRVKFTDDGFASATDGRVMWCKKDTLYGPTSGPDAVAHNAGVPFTTAADWTGTWQDTRWTLREPSSEFFGDEFIANGLRWDQVKVPFAMKVLAPWRDCPGVQALAFGGTYSFATGTLGMEWDKPKGALAAHSFSSSVVDLTNNTADVNGETYNNSAVVTHSIQMVRNGNSFIANFNSDQWAWALDALHLRGNAAADINARQMMLNVIYDLGGTANSTSVSAAGLVLPTAQDIETAYSLSATTDLSTGSALTGTGAIVAGGAVALSGDTSLVGTGALAAAGMIAKSTEATVAGVGTVVTEGLVAGFSTGSISGVGTITTTDSVVVASDSTGDLNGIGATTTTGYVSITTTTTSVGTGTLTVDGAVEKSTTATLAATAILASAGDVAVVGVSGSALLVAIATITTSSVVVQIEHEAIIAETATITVAGFIAMATGASLVGIGRIGPVPPGPRFGVWNGTTFDMLEVGEWNGTAFDMLHLLEAP